MKTTLDKKIILTRRLTLRPFRAEDLDSMHEGWCKDGAVSKYLTWHPHKTRKETEEFLIRQLARQRQGTYAKIITDRKEAIGSIDVVIQLPDGGVEIGYLLKKSAWGQGYMSEAFGATLDYMFLEERRPYVNMRAHIDNKASRHVIEKAGFRFWEIRRLEERDGLTDIAYYTLTREEYLGLREKDALLTLYSEDKAYPARQLKKHRETARGFIVDEEGKLILNLVKRDDVFGNYTYCETPGGGLEDGETPDEALKRECLEELGLEIEILEYLGISSNDYNLLERTEVNHFFLAKAVRKVKEPIRVSKGDDYIDKTVRLSKEEALKAYESQGTEGIPSIVSSREIPVLKKIMGL